MTNKEKAQKLLDAQRNLNGSRGVACVQGMALYLMRGHEAEARAVYDTDRDKLQQYPDLQKVCEKVFGY